MVMWRNYPDRAPGCARIASFRLVRARGELRRGRSGLAHADPGVQAPPRGWSPPIPLAPKLHQGGDEQRADDAGVDQDRERGADPVLLEEDDLRRREGADGDREQERGGGHDAAASLEAERDRLRVGGTVVARLLDP